jgi:hypothetical protein
MGSSFFGAGRLVSSYGLPWLSSRRRRRGLGSPEISGNLPAPEHAPMNINERPDPRASLWAFMAYLLRFHRMQRGASGGALA